MKLLVLTILILCCQYTLAQQCENISDADLLAARQNSLGSFLAATQVQATYNEFYANFESVMEEDVVMVTPLGRFPGIDYAVEYITLSNDFFNDKYTEILESETISFAPTGPDTLRPPADIISPCLPVVMVTPLGRFPGIDYAVEYITLSNDFFNDKFTEILESEFISFGPTGPDTLETSRRYNMSMFANTGLGTYLYEGLVSTFTVEFTPCSAKIIFINLVWDDLFTQLFEEGHLSAAQICIKVVKNCVGQNQQYFDLPDCVNYVSNLPLRTCDSDEHRWAGRAINCFHLHAFMTELNPDTHCPHVSRNSAVCNNDNCDDGFVDNVCESSATRTVRRWW
eukprot:CAMPEP_0201560422 /NCGR_PEP_ID=MMETSP0173_2-20130828/78261_1 /ASSEMBLY_ACC=CAM_ASM_000268 /TAXON_ID=218659 /ORGANISM="Vexillifera sp., Strain DIVA3 564/2" /LENGTH=339 /DNA_ID=CAMNT_0047974869 /DNA_START=48 /DNA_END=1068 /DNA_ORIENTATION=-